MNFNYIGNLKSKSIINEHKIDINKIDKKINLFENFIIIRNKDDLILSIDFWYHFSNVYFTNKNVRSVVNCNNCDKINQLLDS